jgi:hypothetical protein
MASTIHMSGSVPMGKGGEMVEAHKVPLERQLQGMLGGLSAQFLLGLALATIADYNSSTHIGNHAVHQIILLLHMLIALGLIVGSIGVVRAVRRQVPKFGGLALTGLVAILVATVSGLVRLFVDGEWLTFLMGAGFVLAVGAHGQLLGDVLKQHKQHE